MLSAPTSQQLFDLNGQVALVTGGTGHLGFALASALAESGARVIVTSRDLGRAQAAASRLPGARQERHCGLELDYFHGDTLADSFSAAVETCGRIDVLVNNGNEYFSADITNCTADDFNRQLSNATGYFLLARLLRDHAVEHERPASVIMIASMYGLVASYPDAYEGISSASPASYHMLKGGLIHLTRHLAVYWARDKVRVNAISPGPFPGPAAPAELVQRLKSKSPMSRMGSPHELKGAVVFLASAASSYITGHNLVVDGGWTAW